VAIVDHVECGFKFIMDAAVKKFLVLVLFGIGVAVFYSLFGLFVVQPIGAVPEGRTLLILRSGRLNFIDSADAICVRAQGGVNLLCRGMVLGSVVQKTTIVARLPYSETLYLMSTGGKTYEK
jgi:hypothetical protein